MKKIFLSLVVIVMASAAAVGATQAYFSDTETSVGNTFAAGTLDLTVDGKEGPLVVHITRTGLVPNAHWSHSYGGAWVLKNVGSVPGVLSMTIQNVQNGTTICNSAKVAALAHYTLPDCVAGSATGGRLGDLLFGVWSRNDDALGLYGYLSSVYTPFNNMNGVKILPTNSNFTGILNSGDSVTALLDLEWDTHAGTLDNTAQGDTLSFDVVFTLDQVHP